MNTYQFSFEKLDVWQLSRTLASDIYKRTQLFPPEEKYSLISQIRRSALSVSANIAEGTTRSSAKDQAHFTTIAFGSLMELFNHLIIACDLGYIKEEEVSKYREKIQTLSVKLSNLKASQIKRIGMLSLLWLILFASHIHQPLQPFNHIKPF
jgi:four helix bundle protein